MSNSSLIRAKKVKNDEFYTPKWDVEQELSHYHEVLHGKAIYCNCDDPIASRFWKYFYRQFGFLRLKQLIATHYNMDGSPSYALIYKGRSDSAPNFDENVERINLKGNGDFRSDECIEFLKQSDVVVTNPPFSLAREFLQQLHDYHKEFLVVGNLNWVNYKQVFPLFMKHQIWLGVNKIKEFKQPDGSIKKFGNVGWFTNLPVKKSTDTMVVFEDWNFVPHPMYDNYTAWEVSKVVDIPATLEKIVDIDHDKLSVWQSAYKDDLTVLSDDGKSTKIKVKRPIYGVPVSFVDKYNPSSIIPKHNLGKEFDIVGLAAGNSRKDKLYGSVGYIQNKLDRGGCCVVNGKRKYTRIFIRVKPGVTEF